MPSISVVMPLYNKEKYVKCSINSVLFQTFNDFELIVVNDGSTDKSADVVSKINDKRIQLVNQENAGVAAARNKGIELSKAELIAFLDADDKWKPRFLETIFKLKDRFPLCSVYATSYFKAELNGREREPKYRNIPCPWYGEIRNYFKIASVSDPPLFSSAIAVKREAINEINGFPEGINIGEDLLTWAKLAIRYRIAYDSAPHALFQQRNNSYAQPTRVPELPDYVGIKLRELLIDVDSSQAKHFKHYIAWWHKNRANIYFRFNQRSMALKEILKMGYYRIDRKFIIYLLCLTLPFPIIHKMLSFHNRHHRNRL